MTTLELIYEAEEDVLEVTFGDYDDSFARAIPLNEEIVIHTDSAMNRAWGLTLYNYSALLQVTETHLDELKPLDEANRNRILGLITRPPVSSFLELLDSEDLRALVKAPRLNELI